MTVIRAALEYVGDGFSEPLTADPVTIGLLIAPMVDDGEVS